MAEPLAIGLSRWCTETGWADVPDAQRELAKLRILDTLGLIIAVLDSTEARATTDMAVQQGGLPESTLMGASERLPAQWTALVHGTLAHSRDFDDTFIDSVVHPGSTVVPVALAVGEATRATSEHIMTAVALGYEVAARLGGAAGRAFHARGFHASGIIGPLAAAVTAAKLYGLEPRATAQAMGLAGSMAGGLLAFLDDGSWSKWLHLGWAAHGGIVAAQLAERGFPGPVSVLEARNGLYQAFLGEEVAALGSVVADLGKEWRGATAQFKYYPCAHVIQPFIDGALALRAAHGLTVRDIAEVRCAIAPWCVPLVCEPRANRLRPQNELQAIASLPFQVATALVDGAVTLEAISAPSAVKAEVLDLAQRVHHVADEGLGRDFDGRIEIRTTAGRQLAASTVLAGLNPDKVRAKFRRNAAASWDETRIRSVETALEAGTFEPRTLLAGSA